MTTEPYDPQRLATELERLFVQELAVDPLARRDVERRHTFAEETASPPPTPPAEDLPGDPTATTAAGDDLLAHVDDQMDVLRTELELAFEEVVTKLDNASRRADQQMQAFILLRDRVMTLTEGERTGPEPATADDLRALVEGLDRLHHEATAQRKVLAKVTQFLKAASSDRGGDQPAHIEEIVRRGTTANAADIANLRTDVKSLISAIGEQKAATIEMREHMEWIRQRLLGR